MTVINGSDDFFIEHYGTRGMKWGVRKPEGSGVGKPKLPVQKRNLTKEAKKMSDAELKTTVARLQMEKQYRDLVKTEQHKAGKEFALQALKQMSNISIGIATAYVVNKLIKGEGNGKLKAKFDQLKLPGI